MSKSGGASKVRRRAYRIYLDVNVDNNSVKTISSVNWLLMWSNESSESRDIPSFQKIVKNDIGMDWPVLHTLSARRYIDFAEGFGGKPSSHSFSERARAMPLEVSGANDIFEVHRSWSIARQLYVWPWLSRLVQPKYHCCSAHYRFYPTRQHPFLWRLDIGPVFEVDSNDERTFTFVFARVSHVAVRVITVIIVRGDWWRLIEGF